MITRQYSRLLQWASWVSLVAPLLAYVLCSMVSTGHLFVHPPPSGRNVGLLRFCAFLVSAVINVLVLLGDAGLKRWRLSWLPLAGLALTCWLYLQAAWFTRFLD